MRTYFRLGAQKPFLIILLKVVHTEQLLFKLIDGMIWGVGEMCSEWARFTYHHLTAVGLTLNQLQRRLSYSLTGQTTGVGDKCTEMHRKKNSVISPKTIV